MKSTFCLFTFLLLFGFQSRASHLMGGELSYAYDGSNYIITLHLYRDCSGIQLPTTVPITVRSASQSANFTITATQLMTGPTIITIPCPTGTNKCYNTSSTVPGFMMGTYKAIVTLPATASDWVIETNISARSNMTNITGTPNMHLMATLNNLSGPNTNAYIAQHGPFYISTTAVNVPIQAVDADGDSIVYERVAPKSAAGTTVAYNAGYAATTPFGSTGTYTINSSTQTMSLKANTFGNYTLAFLVKEYRSGNLIATYIRDFAVAALAGSITYSYPVLNSPSSAKAYACPGAAGSATLSFTDPVSTDSVFVEVDTPASVTGWNFNISTTSGTPTGAATISWTAPSSLNPSTLPYFYVKLRVRDNACPRGDVNYTLLVKTQQCPTDSVWPGDANSDKVANLLDVLAIAVAYNQAGPVRPGASISWTPQWSANWANTYPFSTVNVKHGDCNGNGIINIGDLPAIAANYGLTHLKGGPKSKTSGVPDLYFDFAGITLYPGATVSVPVKLGTAASPMNDIYGLGTSININGLTPTTQATATTATSWLGNGSNALEFSKNFSKSTFDWAFARTDHQNVSGDGTIAMLNFTVPSNAVPGTTVNFVFGNTVMIDKDGNSLSGFNPVDASAIVQPTSVSSATAVKIQATVIPNPSAGNARLQVALADAQQLDIIIMDIAGKTVYTKALQMSQGNNYVELPASELAEGVYTIRIAGGQQEPLSLKWVKQ